MHQMETCSTDCQIRRQAAGFGNPAGGRSAVGGFPPIGFGGFYGTAMGVQIVLKSPDPVMMKRLVYRNSISSSWHLRSRRFAQALRST